MNKRHTYIFIILAHLLMSSMVRAQSNLGIQQLEVSYTNAFSLSDIPYADKCFKHLFSDQQGRLWLVPCSVEQLINGANLFQFDGYQFHFIPITLIDSSQIKALVFRQVNSNGQIIGWTPDSDFFLANTDSWQARIIPPADTSLGTIKIRNAVAIGEEIYLTALSTQDSILLLKSERDSLRLEQAFDYNDGIWRVAPYPLLVDDQEIWLSGANLPIYQYNRVTGSVRAFRQKDFQPLSPILKQNSSAFLEISPTILKQKETVFLYLPGYYGHLLFRLDREKEQFISINENFPAIWTPQNIFQDDIGNICFVFQDQAKNYHSILRTPGGELFDYSDITQGQSKITEMKSHDFRQEVLIISPNGLTSVGVQKKGAITTIMSNQPVNSMAELPDGRFLVNVRQGEHSWYLYEPTTGQASPFKGSDCGATGAPFGPGMKQQIIPDQQGRLWFLANDYLVAYNPYTNTCASWQLDSNGKLFGFINETIAIILTNQGLVVYDIQTGEKLTTSLPLKTIDKLFFRDIFIDSKGLIWLPTNEGLWQIDWEKQNLQRIDEDLPFDDHRFTTIYEDKQGLMWIGTYFGGLHLYDPKSGEIQILNQQRGLASNAIMSILPDAEGDIWLGTEQGISLVSRSGEIMGSFHREDGLNDEKFERFDPFRSKEGLLYFNNRSGVNVLNPELLKQAMEQRSQPQLFLTELAYFNTKDDEERVQRNQFKALKRVQIPASRPYIRLKFGLSSYLEPQKNQYAYRIDRPGEDWRYLGSQPELFINRLPSGKYNLLIKGADFRNRWTEPIAIPIRARRIFYQQAWFYLLLALPFVIFAAIWVANKRREAERLEQEVAERTQQIENDKVLIQQQADQLEKLNQLKDKFFIDVAHELRTPLTLVTTPLDYLLQQKNETFEAETRKDLQQILRNAENLEERVEEFLELSRLDTKKAVLEPSPTPLGQYCKTLFAAFQPLAAQKNIDYLFSLQLDPEAIYSIDQKRLTKVINNLLFNAFKFTPEGGQIELRVEQSEAGIQISVSDTGLGIEASDLPHIFDLYFQGQAPKGGLGIGLALSKELVELMDGQLLVDSQVGQGTTFKVLLPLQLQPLASHLAPEPAASPDPRIAIQIDPSPQTSSKGKLLMVEDNPEMQQLLRKILNKHYEVVLANDGKEAWQWLKNKDARVQNIELLLTDIMMPEMDGYTLVEKMKSHPEWQGLPVVMLTALHAQTHKMKGLRIGVDDYLTKPFAAEELLVRIENLLRNYRSRIPDTPNLEEAQATSTGPDSSDFLWLAEMEQAALEALEQKKKLNTAYLANRVFLSERHLLRKLKAITGLTPNAYIQEIKLEKARKLLENKVYTTVSEVAQACGYQSASYFSKIYQQRFGKSPKDYARE